MEITGVGWTFVLIEMCYITRMISQNRSVINRYKFSGFVYKLLADFLELVKFIFSITQ